MARASTLLILSRATEAAFSFDRSRFRTELVESVIRFREMPVSPEQR
jgi:hypothetical protein